MQFSNTFEIPLPPDVAWAVLMDIRRIAPCMPGAELTEIVDADTYKGKVSVRLGPVALAFAGTATFESRDAAARMARVKAQGADSKGRGSASATVEFRLEPVGTGTKVVVTTDLTLSGSVAQYGRGAGMIQSVATQLINQFAKSLKEQIGETPVVPAASAPTPASTDESASAPIPLAAAAAPDTRALPLPAAAKPISGFSLFMSAIWASLLGLFRSKKAQ